MMRIRFSLLIAVVLVTLLGIQIGSVAAGGGGADWHAQTIDNVGCNSGDIALTTLLSNVTFPTTLHFFTTVDAGGLRYMDEDAGTPGSGNGVYGWHLYNSSSGGPTTATFPIPDNTSITIHLMLIDSVGSVVVSDYSYTIQKCNSNSGAPALPDSRTLYLFYADTPILTGTNVTTVVGSNAIHACQTGFIIATSSDGQFGQLYMMGGWVSLAHATPVQPSYGQPGGQPVDPGCVGR